MNNLTPVQRHDRNGKLVTRHVKTESSSPTSMSSVPAPKLSISGNNPALADGWRLVPSQTRIKRRTLSGAPVTYGEESAFEASDVEMYTVMSVTSPPVSLELLAAGVSSPEEAVDYLTAEGRQDDIVDNADLAREMLARHIPVEFCLMGLERLNEDQVHGADPELMADYLEFFSIRSIMRKDSPKIADEVLSGEIRLSDVRAVGIDHLKTGGRLEIARAAFKELKKGTDKFTVEDLTDALQKRISDDVAAEVAYLIKFGSDSIGRLKFLFRVDGFGGPSIGDLVKTVKSDTGTSQEDALAVIDYTARVVEGSEIEIDPRSGLNVHEVLSTGIFLHNAGVDVRYAAERINKEEPREIAASFHETHKAVGEGWL